MTAPIPTRAHATRPTPAVEMPRLALSVGVTGHRPERLAPERIEAVTRSVAGILAAIAVEAGARTTDDAAPSIRLVSGLADGADGIVADAATGRGWTLDAVLPFARDTFAADFPEGGAIDSYRRRLAAANAVLELPGERARPDGAYEQAGRTILAQSDLLIAVWDNQPPRGRGGTAQIVAEAVLRGIPVIQIDPDDAANPRLLWDGLEEHDLGEQTVETVARGGLDRLPSLVADLLDPPAGAARLIPRDAAFARSRRRRILSLAWPLLLTVTGARNAGRAHSGATDDRPPALATFAPAKKAMLERRFARADAHASELARLFRSGYVTNFAFAAIAVVLSLMGLALPAWFKPVLIVLELATIGTILGLTRGGNRAGWHRRWLDDRQLAERLRCLAISAQLGELDLHGGYEDMHGWVGWYARATARELGLPDARVDAAYLAGVRGDLVRLINGQIAYLSADAHRMHHLEHRLHRIGTWLFALTAVICTGLLGFEIAVYLTESPLLEAIAHPIVIGATIGCAAFPAIGAAIYGIRMQGDFAGIAERGESLRHHLGVLRKAIDEDEGDFDTLRRRVRRATELLTEDLASWLKTYRARPLSLPG